MATFFKLITISGTPGAGKGTAAQLLSRKLKIPAYSIGDIRRSLAKDRGMTLEQFNRYGETYPETDRDVDRWQGTIAKRKKVGIFDGRVSYYFIPQSFKVFLRCDKRVGAWRVMHDPAKKRKNEADHSTIKKTMASLRRRAASDARRYRAFYGISIFDRSQYDLVLSTTNKTPEQVARAIMAALKKWSSGRNVGK